MDEQLSYLFNNYEIRNPLEPSKTGAQFVPATLEIPVEPNLLWPRDLMGFAGSY